MTSPVIECRQLVQIYRVESSEIMALQGLDLTVDRGEMLGIVGASGSGKSTLLTVLSGLLQPTGGRVRVDGHDLNSFSKRELDRYRQRDLGFIWQETGRNLVPYLSAIDNVALPLRLAGQAKGRSRAREILDMVGLGDRMDHRPNALSGGEQQRVALAVALAHQPVLLLADEPTGELDTDATAEMFALMRTIGNESGVSQVIVSHDRDLTSFVDRVVMIRDGRVATEQRQGVSTSSHRAIAPQTTTVLLVDGVGRLQLPPEHAEALGITDRVQADLVGDAIEIRRADPPAKYDPSATEKQGTDD